MDPNEPTLAAPNDLTPEQQAAADAKAREQDFDCESNRSPCDLQWLDFIPLFPRLCFVACHAVVDAFYVQLNEEFARRKKTKTINKVLELNVGLTAFLLDVRVALLLLILISCVSMHSPIS